MILFKCNRGREDLENMIKTLQMFKLGFFARSDVERRQSPDHDEVGDRGKKDDDGNEFCEVPAGSSENEKVRGTTCSRRCTTGGKKTCVHTFAGVRGKRREQTGRIARRLQEVQQLCQAEEMVI